MRTIIVEDELNTLSIDSQFGGYYEFEFQFAKSDRFNLFLSARVIKNQKVITNNENAFAISGKMFDFPDDRISFKTGMSFLLW